MILQKLLGVANVDTVNHLIHHSETKSAKFAKNLLYSDHRFIRPNSITFNKIKI